MFFKVKAQISHVLVATLQLAPSVDKLTIQVFIVSQ